MVNLIEEKINMHYNTFHIEIIIDLNKKKEIQNENNVIEQK